MTERFFAAKRRHPSGAGQESGGSDEDDKDYFASDLYRNLEARRSQIREVIGESIAYITRILLLSVKIIRKRKRSRTIASNQFGITIETHEAVFENLNTLSDIARFVMSKKG